MTTTTKTRPTFASVRKELQAIGVTIRANDYNEYAVRVTGDRENDPVFIDRGHTTESQIEALEEALLEGRALAKRAEKAAALVPPPGFVPAPVVTRYRMASSPLVYAPGLVAWGINGYAFKSDRPQIEKIFCDVWSLPLPAVRALMSKAVPYELDGETVVFQHVG